MYRAHNEREKEHIVTTSKTERKRSRGRQGIKIIARLSTWYRPSATERVRTTNDHIVWRRRREGEGEELRWRERERKGEKGRERERKGEKGRERERKGEKGRERDRERERKE